MYRNASCCLITIAAFGIAVAAAAEERSASWYADHPKERAAVSTLCKDYASQARSNPNCDNAFQGNLIAGEREARRRTQTAQAGQRDSGVSNLGTSLEYWRNPANAENRAFWAGKCVRAEADGVPYETLRAMWCPAIKAAGGY